MASRVLRYRTSTPVPTTTTLSDEAALLERFRVIRQEQGVPSEFPSAVLVEAQRAAGSVALPERD
ncbi:MAG: RNB domain-containing ribonuclease, partial [Actinomycetota bacterium]|nr:RNB domain-containing ribonuclease [Actinomycetota bacterium]